MTANLTDWVKTTASATIIAVSSLSSTFASADNVCSEGTPSFDEDKCMEQIQDMMEEDLDNSSPPGYFTENVDTIASYAPIQHTFKL